jgi:hypothetical protein
MVFDMARLIAPQWSQIADSGASGGQAFSNSDADPGGSRRRG